jgi:hypothetical protein
MTRPVTFLSACLRLTGGCGGKRMKSLSYRSFTSPFAEVTRAGAPQSVGRASLSRRSGSVNLDAGYLTVGTRRTKSGGSIR